MGGVGRVRRVERVGRVGRSKSEVGVRAKEQKERGGKKSRAARIVGN